MNVKILDKENIRESVPIEIEIENTNGIPHIYVENLGEVKAHLFDKKYMAKFWAMKKGDYQIIIKDKDNTWSGNILVNEQKYLTFGQEFGLFVSIFFIVSLGVFIWMKKLKRARP